MSLTPPLHPQWLPDETLFSLCSRIHRLSCNSLSSTTTQSLFGSKRVGQAHDLPGGLDLFVKRSMGGWGGVDEIIYQHTLLPYYLPFRKGADVDARAAMASPNPGGLKYRLGLVTSRFRAHHPLKACPACMAEDEAQHHVAYWRLAHQYPSVWICPDHHTPLRVSTVKANGVRRFQWLLPDEGEFELREEVVWSHRPSATDIDTLLLLANNSIALARLASGFHIESARMVETYRRQLVSRGLTSASGLVSWQNVSSSYIQAISPLRTAAALCALPVSTDDALVELGRFLRNPDRNSTHPVRHLALIQWLFGDLQAFLDAYSDTEAPEHGIDASDDYGRETVSDPRRADFIELITQQQYSVTRASRSVGIDTTTGMFWATQAGIAFPRRAKALRPQRRAALVAALGQGMDKTEAAERFGVSVVTVTTTLRTEIGLHQAWIEARTSAKRTQHRSTWLALSSKHPDCGVRDLRRLEPATYAWLYRNDRAWLNQAVGSLPKLVAGNHAHVPWDRRDEILAREIELAAADIAISTRKRSVALWQLLQRLPELKAKLGALNQLPLTRRILARVTARRE